MWMVEEALRIKQDDSDNEMRELSQVNYRVLFILSSNNYFLLLTHVLKKSPASRISTLQLKLTVFSMFPHLLFSVQF